MSIPPDFPKMTELEEGCQCPSCESGAMEFERNGACSCHIRPPCNACTESFLKCTFCGYEDREDNGK